MAYLSDVDLATLHQSRLEERVQYRLSALWTHGAESGRDYQRSLPAVSSSASSSSTSLTMFGDREAAKLRAVKQSHHHASSSGGGKHVEWSDDDHLHDDGYFSSDTRRRRSGTWPSGHQQQQQNNHRHHQSNGAGGGYSPSAEDDIPADEDQLLLWRPKRRTRSLNAPSPFQQFGPCGRIMKNSAMVMQIQDPASQRLTWYKPPLAVLVIKKVRDSKVLQPFVQLVEWLIHEKHMVVWVEAAILDDALLTGDKRFTKLQDKLITFKDGRDDLTDKIDFIICLGGDGTLLYASLLFQKSVPPVMAFHLGSLGFLTPFQFDNFQEQVTNVLEGHAALTLRSRLRCIIVRKDKTEQEISTFKSSQDPSTNILVLNEVVIDRGLSSYLSNIDLFLDGKHITSVQGDGLIVSTPTGSTAYSAAAGASMIHPSVPAILVTPICPHSLSFRPIVLPAGVELKIAISPDSRNSSWVSFDGRNRQELLHGDSLHVTTSIYPVPSICAQDQIADWFDSLAECLHWNVRKRQKCLDELSDLTGSGTEDSAIDDIVRGIENLEN
uniref:NAD(+) kinase n=1 Tax=Anopheles quadriannulatus TaxID=34691 RepID=A0A182X5Q8_ANOQN